MEKIPFCSRRSFIIRIGGSLILVATLLLIAIRWSAEKALPPGADERSRQVSSVRNSQQAQHTAASLNKASILRSLALRSGMAPAGSKSAFVCQPPPQPQARTDSDGYRFHLEELHYDADITTAGLSLKLANSSTAPVLEGTLEAVGRERGMVSVAGRTVARRSSSVEIDGETVTEWYRCREKGLEQGFTVKSNPVRGEGPLRLDLRFSREWDVQILPGQDALVITHGAGSTSIRYEGLKVSDAAGRHLDARFVDRDGEGKVSVLVADANATYPVVVDPVFVVEKIADMRVALPYGSLISSPVMVGSTLFFVAQDPAYGIELWKSDGTNAGTMMVKDIAPGALPGQTSNVFSGGDSYSSTPSNLVALGDRLYFSATDGSGTNWLWVSDGTSAGTLKLKNLSSVGFAPSSFTVAGSRLYFMINDYYGSTSSQMWTSDGTGPGTVLLMSGLPGGGFYQNHRLSPFGESLLFLKSTSELWKTDGTYVGMVKDLGLATVMPSNNPMCVVDGVAFFSNYGLGSTQVWRSDGTSAGTFALGAFTDLNANSLTGSGSQVFFTSGRSETGYQLWRSDATATDATWIAAISSYPYAYVAPVLKAFDGGVLFAAHTSATGYELWRSDGSVSGTGLVKDLQAGSASSSPIMITAAGPWAYFFANRSNYSYELWRTDGSSAGTTLVSSSLDFGENGIDVTPVGDSVGRLYFVAADPSLGRELWASDGTSGGTGVVKNINGGSSVSATYGSPVALGSSVYFAADDGVHGSELWKSDGTLAGTIMVKDIVPGAGASSPYCLTVLNGQLLFFADHALWKSDGTEGGTSKVFDVQGPRSGYDTNAIAVLGSTLYFSGYRYAEQRELWKTDGTPEGTQMVKDIAIGYYTTSSDPGSFAVMGGALYFSATDSNNDRELWRSDGTSGGTSRVVDINAYRSSYPSDLVAIPGMVCFTATTSSGVRQLWKTDGTAQGTSALSNMDFSSNSRSIQNLRLFGGSLCFVSADPYGTGLWYLWRSDGTVAGTSVVTSFPYSGSALVTNGSMNSLPTAEAGGMLFFVGNDAAHGLELWKTDLTAGGTQMVKDIWSGTPSSTPLRLTGTAGGFVYFSAADETHGYELWRSDGSSQGTVMVEDLMPGADSSQPSALTAADKRLFYLAVAPGVAGWQLRVTSMKWQLAVGSSSGGTVTGGGVFDDGVLAPVSATPSAGYVFAGWSGAGVQDTISIETAVSMTDDRTVTASFSPVPSFFNWAAGAGLSGPNSDPLANPSHDGLPNLLKYAFNLDPALPDVRTLPTGSGDSGLPSIRTAEFGGSRVMHFEFVRRRGAQLVYAPEISSDLSVGSWHAPASCCVVQYLSPYWERVTIDEPMPAGDSVRMFGRVRITQP